MTSSLSTHPCFSFFPRGKHCFHPHVSNGDRICHFRSLALEVAFDGKKYSTNIAFLHDSTKQNSACVLLKEGLLYSKHTRNTSIVLCSTDFLDMKVSHLAPFRNSALMYFSILSSWCCLSSPTDFTFGCKGVV